MKRSALTQEDRERQLPLLPVPLYSVEHAVLACDDVQPGVRRRGTKAVPETGALHATGDTAFGPDFGAILSVCGAIAWQCDHVPFGSWPLTAITTAALEDFKVKLTAAEPSGKGLKMETARTSSTGRSAPSSGTPGAWITSSRLSPLRTSPGLER
jgi:hypothetical protein